MTRKRPSVLGVAGSLAGYGSGAHIKTLRKAAYTKRGAQLAQRAAGDYNRAEQMADLEALLAVCERVRRIEREKAQARISALESELQALQTRRREAARVAKPDHRPRRARATKGRQ